LLKLVISIFKNFKFLKPLTDFNIILKKIDDKKTKRERERERERERDLYAKIVDCAKKIYQEFFKKKMFT